MLNLLRIFLILNDLSVSSVTCPSTENSLAPLWAMITITLFNVPRVASAAYNVVKGFLDPVTAEKIELFAGVPYDRFKEMMSDDVIPMEYGGKNEVEYPQTAKN